MFVLVCISLVIVKPDYIILDIYVQSHQIVNDTYVQSHQILNDTFETPSLCVPRGVIISISHSTLTALDLMHSDCDLLGVVAVVMNCEMKMRFCAAQE
jgi:hypothetical protein